jgi:PAS domain S-box-containing protein
LTDRSVLKTLRMALEKWQTCRVEVLNYKKDGSTFWSEFEVTPVANETGHYTHWISVQRDVTERKQAEEELKNKADDIERIFNLSAYMVCIASSEGTFKKVSPAFTETLGFSEKAFHANPFLDFVHPDDKTSTAAKLEAINRGIPAVQFQNRYVCHDGSYKWLEWTARSFVNGEDLYAIAYDITQSKQTEKDLEEHRNNLDALVKERTHDLTLANEKLKKEIVRRKKTELALVDREINLKQILMELENLTEFYRLLTEVSPSGIWQSTPDGDNIYVSPKWTEITGINAVNAKKIGWADHIHPEDKEKIDSDRHIAKEKGLTWNSEFRFVSPDGIEKWILAIAFPEKRNNKVESWIGTITDITDRKQSEQALQHSHDNLEKRVWERTLVLQKTHAQLLHAEKMSSIGRLSASIAHEFNNPLQGIMNIIQGIKKRAYMDVDDSELMALALKECHRMRDLIKSLQDFNRPTAGIIAPVDIHATLDSILLLSKKEYATREISIIKKYTNNLPQVIVVSDQVKQVFLNLLNNAFDASFFGGRIILETDLSENNIVIRIHDAGSGICLKDREHIFEPFFTTKAKMKGTGLGLSISYGIIKDHGGNITVESKQGKGSIFSVFLPIKRVPNEEK